jgi:hypothetical protein
MAVQHGTLDAARAQHQAGAFPTGSGSTTLRSAARRREATEPSEPGSIVDQQAGGAHLCGGSHLAKVLLSCVWPVPSHTILRARLRSSCATQV